MVTVVGPVRLVEDVVTAGVDLLVEGVATAEPTVEGVEVEVVVVELPILPFCSSQSSIF